MTGRFDGVPTSIGFATGKVGPAFRFAGTNSYVGVNNHATFNAITNITFECWIWNDDTKPFQRLLSLTPDWMILAIDQSGKLSFTVHYFDQSEVGTSATVAATSAFPTRAWHHVAGTYDSKAVSLFIDGVLVASKDALGRTENRGATPGILINFPNGGEVGGLIDEIAIYSRALTAGEIQSHFLAGSAGMAKKPVFSTIGLFFPGSARLTVKGQAGKPVTLQASTNLIDWIVLGTDANVNGTVNFSDTSAGAVGGRFYRAIME